MRLILILVFVLFATCSNQPTSVEKEDPTFQIHQIPGCVQDPLKKTVTFDPCFTYAFEDTLKVDVCLSSNCCPDADRFDYSYVVANNTIKVTVVDTAEHLCDCICNYIVHSEISGLELDAYIYECIYNGSVCYQQLVVRKK